MIPNEVIDTDPALSVRPSMKVSVRKMFISTPLRGRIDQSKVRKAFFDVGVNVSTLLQDASTETEEGSLHAESVFLLDSRMPLSARQNRTDSQLQTDLPIPSQAETQSEKLDSANQLLNQLTTVDRRFSQLKAELNASKRLHKQRPLNPFPNNIGTCSESQTSFGLVSSIVPTSNFQVSPIVRII